MKPHGHRSFYYVPDSAAPSESRCAADSQPQLLKGSKKFRTKSSLFRGNCRDLIEMIETNVIGRGTVFQGPFGPRRTIYVDHTASGQSMRCIEDFVRDQILPYYANTHTTGTLTSAQTTYYRHEARDIVRNSVGASEHDVVIFCGSGATGPVHKLVNALTGDRTKPRPLVFIGPFEHHSNILPWRDIGAKVITIPETSSGEFDIGFLESSLREAAIEGIKDRLLIGSFSVASNVTGMFCDDVAITILLHKYGALSLWDYSAGAPHAQIVMNPVVVGLEDQGLAKKDALFFSGHKFVGGPQTPGVLIAKDAIFGSHQPNCAGGGTVFFVSENSHRYLKNTEYREEGGTPAIVESIRLGLVFKLKETIGSHNIIFREANFAKKILDEWSQVPQIHILGSISNPRVPIISFLIEHLESGYYLHHNYVVVLLNDLFGIQARGGCLCAGPYGQNILGIDVQLALEYEALLLDDSRLDRVHLRRRSEGSAYELFRPGFIRISIPYYTSVQEAEFVSKAVQLVAKHGWKLLPMYNCNPETGEFHHHLNPTVQHRKWLSWATFNSEGIRCKERTRNNSEDSANYSECLEQAKNIFSNAFNLCKRRPLQNQSLIFDPSVAHLKWFLLPSESPILKNSSACSASDSQLVKSPKPFRTKTYTSPSKQSESVKYYPYSIPYQIMQSATWSSARAGNMNSNTKSSYNNTKSVKNRNCDSFTSSSNDSDNEFLVAGATVTGPSICFTNRINIESHFSSESPPNLSSMNNKLTQVDKENNNSGNFQTFTANGLNFGSTPGQYPLTNDNQSCLNPPMNDINESSVTNFPFSHNTGPTGEIHSNYMNVTNCTIQTPNELVQRFCYEELSTPEGISGSSVQINPVPVSPNSYSMCNSPGLVNFNPYCTDTINMGMTKMNLNIESRQQTPEYIPQNSQNQMYNDNFAANTNNQGVYGCALSQFSQNVNGTMSPDMNCGYSMLPCPSTFYPQVPQHQQQQMMNCQTFQQENMMSNLMPMPTLNITSASPIPSYTSMNMSPGPGSPVFQDELVNIAMRRVTDEIANELKFEIREVITQVEQGMDPDGARGRADSFNSRDKRLEQFKKRARTLSGQVLNGSFMKSECEDGSPATAPSAEVAASFARSKTIDAIWNSVDSSKQVESSPSEAISLASHHPPKGKDHTKIIGGTRWHCPPKNIIKATLGALNDFPMIQNGDRLLLCLSGGKDSLSLLHTIKQVQYILAKKEIVFTFGAVTVDPGSSAYNPRPLIPYLEALGVPYFYEEQGIMPTALEKGPEGVSSICSFCSRLKRGRIYSTARTNNYNVLALGQHLDDLAESFFMSIFHNGLMRTMKACYIVKEGDLRVIRPFINVREKSLRDFAESHGLPIIPENCPACFDTPTERHRVKQLLAQQEILFPRLYLSLRSAMQPLIAINKTGMESSVRSGKQLNNSDPCNHGDDQFCK